MPKGKGKGKGKEKEKEKGKAAKYMEERCWPPHEEEDIWGSVSTICPPNDYATTFPISSSYEEESCRFNMKLSCMERSLGVLNLSDNKNRVLMDEPYELTLTEALAALEDGDVWSEEHDAYVDYQEICNLESVVDWNPTRLDTKCQGIIRGTLKAVNTFHRLRGPHGNLSDTDNYLLSHAMDGSVKAVLINPNPNSSGCNEASDMRDVERIIFRDILGRRGTPLPLILQDLQSRMTSYHVDATQSIVIQEHPSLWHNKKRLDYFGKLWLHIADNVAIMVAIDSASNRTDVEWHKYIPMATPLYTFLQDDHNYNATMLGLFTYIRHLFLHLPDKCDNERKYFKQDEHNYYLDNQFLEAVIGEMFPFFLVDIFETMVANDAMF